jgi:DnaJ-domain-containing protein 1
MSIGKRLIDLARAELNSLLDRAAARADQDEVDDEDREFRRSRGDGEFAGMSDDELAAEIERRRRAREEVEDVLGGRRSRPEPPPRRPAPPRTAAGDDALRKAYAALEVPAGSDFETVRKSYRRLMRKYHPDLHGGTAEKQRAATDLTQRLTQAYKTIEKHARR